MAERINIIIKASWVGIIGNLLLALLKVSIGFFSGSQAVIGDGIDSLSDVATYLITLLTARVAQKPPNRRYPYGYSRAETIATKALAFFILFAGAQILYNNAKDLVMGISREIPNVLAVYVTLLSVFGKLLLSWWQSSVAKKTQSSMLLANARNMQADMILSLAVLLGLSVSVYFGIPMIDSLMALGVSGWIIKIGYEIFMESNTELMEGVDDMSIYQKVFDAADAVPGTYNPHRARIRKMSNLYLIDLDIEVDGTLNVAESHQIGEKVEREIKLRITNVYDIMIHVEPKGNVEHNERYGLTKEDI